MINQHEVHVGEREDAPDDTIDLYAVAQRGAACVRERYIRDADRRTLIVHREEWHYVYPHVHAPSGEERGGTYERRTNRTMTFDLAGDEVATVEHDGRRWTRYARERFRELMAKRFRGEIHG